VESSEAIAAEAVEVLRTALLSGHDIGGAVRWCYYRNPAFCTALFAVSVRRWFAPDRDIRDITDFTARIKESRPADMVAFPAMEAEAYIRFMRGETYLFDDMDPEAIAYSEITVAVLTALFEEWRPRSDEVADLLEQAASHVPTLTESSPTKQMIDDWYEIGMHMSPLASLATDVGDQSESLAFTRSGFAHLRAGRALEASEEFTRAIEIDPSNRLALEGRGDSHQLLQRHDDALADFDRAMALDPDSASALVGRGAAYRDLDRYDEAFADFARAIAAGSPQWAVRALVARGLAYMDLGRYADAAADYTAALERDPDNAELYDLRSKARFQLTNYAEALGDSTRAIELAPGDESLYGWRGEILRMMERYSEAVEALDRAIAIEPDRIFVLARRGDALLAIDRYEEAIADYNRAIELDSDYADPLVGRGLAYLDLGRRAEAEADFSRALQLDPSLEDEIAEYLRPG
jgi:tetratricopeptide (TPR) repeat protein